MPSIHSLQEERTRGRPSIAELARAAAAAASTAIVCAPMLAAARPKTPLRVFGVAAFEYFARVGGATLGPRRRRAMAYACDFGALRDVYYDHGKLDRAEYRSLRLELRRDAPEPATCRYIRELRHAERTRPNLAAGTVRSAAVIDYRTRVLDTTIEWLREIAGLRIEPARLHAFLSVACLVQLADDLLDWEEDEAAGCPGYVAAFTLDRPRTEAAVPLRAEADGLLRGTLGAARHDAGAAPFAAAAVLAWVFVAALLWVKPPR